MSEKYLENCAPVARKKVKVCDEMLEKFTSWMKERGIKISPKVKITKNGSCARYGMVATADIGQDEVLFTIPKTALLWPNTCSIKDELMKSEDLESESGWCKLITCLMLEYTTPESDFAPYLEFLPKVEELNHPMFWSEEDRTDLLKGTGVDVKVKNDLKHIEFEYNMYVKPFLAKHKDLGFDVNKHTLGLYKHMVALVMAYSFSDEDGDEIPKMVPLADVLNHVSLNNAQLEFNENSLDMIAQRCIKAGEEIYNTYGQLNNCKLLQNYGFVEEYPDNVLDNVELSMKRVAHFAATSLKVKGKFDCIGEKISWLETNHIWDDLLFSNEGLLNVDEFFFFVKFLQLNQDTFKRVRAMGDSMEIEELCEQFSELDTPDLVDDDDILRYGELKLLLSEEIKCVLHEAVVERLVSFPYDDDDDQLPSTAADIQKHLSAKLIEGQKELLALLDSEFSKETCEDIPKETC